MAMLVVYSSTRREVRVPSRPAHILAGAAVACGHAAPAPGAGGDTRRVGLTGGSGRAASLSPSAAAPMKRIPRAISGPV
jgi:hypothetical protein